MRLSPALAEHGLGLVEQHGGVEGLDQEVVRPSPASRLKVGRGVVGGHDEHRDRGQAGIGTDLCADGIAVDAGIRTSSTTRSGRTATALANAPAPSRAVTTSKPSRRKLISMKQRMSASSSATSTVAANAHPFLRRSDGSVRDNHPGLHPQPTDTNRLDGSRILSSGPAVDEDGGETAGHCSTNYGASSPGRAPSAGGPRARASLCGITRNGDQGWLRCRRGRRGPKAQPTAPPLPSPRGHASERT